MAYYLKSCVLVIIAGLILFGVYASLGLYADGSFLFAEHTCD